MFRCGTSAPSLLAESGTATHKDNNMIYNHVPLKIFGGHKDEGYSIDWDPIVTGRLISGDCNKCIHLWEPTSGNWTVGTEPFFGHSGSVEDLQACHEMMLASCLIASGCDDGSISVLDVRSIRRGESGNSVVAHFVYHKHPITSVEWSPHESSTLAASSAGHQLTIWDLSLERDAEEEAEFRAKMKEQANAPEDLPPQLLLFVHQGQRDLKELHWHPQIPGMIMSTAADGFNVLMPSNIDTTISSPGASVPMSILDDITARGKYLRRSKAVLLVRIQLDVGFKILASVLVGVML